MRHLQGPIGPGKSELLFMSVYPLDAAAVLSVGQELECMRQSLGMKLSDVAAGLPVAFRHLRALEQGNPADLPPASRLTSVRAYAHFLGLDPDVVGERYEKALGDAPGA